MLEWRNAIVLWVNLDGSNNNLFSAEDGGGMTMTWYASPRTTEKTPVVQRLIAAKDGTEASADTVLLFCRLKGEPYVCCGRLGYVSHVPRRQPLKFVWRLRDMPQLHGKADFEAFMLGKS